MKTVVNEPQAEYKVTGWLPTINTFPFDENICCIENNTILVYPPRGIITQLLFEKPKKRLSSLRGKMTRQSEKEIDDQISDIRNEWDRNI